MSTTTIVSDLLRPGDRGDFVRFRALVHGVRLYLDTRTLADQLDRVVATS